MAARNHGSSAVRGRRRARPSFPDRWDLTHLAKDPVRQLDQLLADLGTTVTRIEAARPRLSPDMSSEEFRTVLTLSETVAHNTSRIGAFAYLWFSENTTDPQARSFKSRVEERLAALNNRLLFFELWWQSVDKKNASRLMTDAGDLRYHLETIRRFKPHTLSEPEEKIINLKNVTGHSAIHTLYDVVTNGLTFTVTVAGKKKTVNREGLMAFVRHQNASLRQAAYEELYRGFLRH